MFLRTRYFLFGVASTIVLSMAALRFTPSEEFFDEAKNFYNPKS